MTTAEDLAVVVELALLTEDLTRPERAALLRVAQRVDREINRQTTSNPHLDGGVGLDVMPPCTYPGDHGKTCVCRGDGVAREPRGGWSLLARRIEQRQETT